MKQNDYRAAMDRIKAGEELKDKIIREITSDNKAKNKVNFNKLIAILGVLIIVLAMTYLPLLSKLDRNIGTNPPIKKNENFRIIGKNNSNIEADYALVLYLDGFSYEYSGWISHNHNYYEIKDIEYLRGEKIGEVKLDLKGLKYEGIPPDFSSTYEKGTEIYEIKGLKRSNALLLDDGNISFILYNGGRVTESLSQPIDLSVKEVIEMITDFPLISEVELRNEENGSWMRSSHDEDLLESLNLELPKAKIYNYEEDNRPKYESSFRVPVNLFFEDGAVLHAQVYPETNSAYIFGGFINISEDLSNKFKDLNRLGDQYPRFTSLLGYDRYNIGYFQIRNFIEGDNIISKEPSWSGSALYGIFDHYTVDEDDDLEGRLVASIKIGESEEAYKEIEIYEGKDTDLFFRIGGKAYRIVKGALRYKDIVDFIKNYTEV